VTRDELEIQLNDLDPAKRREALAALCDLVARGDVALPAARDAVNLHCHTFFSYNGYGYSPSFIAWKARCEGLRMAGVVDFDVLDAVDEFLAAARAVGLKACAGIETRVYVPPFATREINSPGEPGVAYFMGVGFVSSSVKEAGVLAELKTMAQQRNRGIMERVNSHVAPVTLDYEADVLPLTPNGNATERHLCTAYDAKSRERMPDADVRAAFWAAKLGGDADAIKAAFDDPPTFQGMIRAKTMKAGGVGYVKAEGADFPTMERVSAFALENGAIPAYAFLDGLTEGEQSIEELLDVAAGHGAAALNIIPDRNWNLPDPEVKRRKVKRLHEVVAIAQARGLPVVVGTEMNAYGQKFVDDFDADALAPLVPVFLEGAHILYAHTALEGKAGLGYLSDWARRHFSTTADKNVFYQTLGERLDPADPAALDGITDQVTPDEVLDRA